MRFRRDKSDALHIIDGLESAVADGYIYGQWPSVAEHLSEHVQNGLTLACSRGNILVERPRPPPPLSLATPAGTHFSSPDVLLMIR